MGINIRNLKMGLKFKTALIDGDRIVMGAGFGSEKVVNGELIHIEPLNHALYKAKMILSRILDSLSVENYVLYLGCTESKHFRYEVAKTQPYKGNRKKTKRPEHENAIREYLMKYHNTIVVSGVEVDDALGIDQTTAICEFNDNLDFDFGIACDISFNNPESSTIICSNDKDLDMIPGWHYDVDWGIERIFGNKSYKMKSHKENQIYFIYDPGFLKLYKSETGKKKLYGGGQLWFCAQLLMGDKTDNIPGCMKDLRGTYGDVSAYEVLKDCKSYKDGIKLVWECYKKVGLTKDRLFEVARLLWIKRNAKGDKIFSRSWLE